MVSDRVKQPFTIVFEISTPIETVSEITVAVSNHILESVGKERELRLEIRTSSPSNAPMAGTDNSSKEITVTEAAHLLGTSRQNILSAIRRGRITARKVGKRLYLVQKSDVLAYQETCQRRRKKKNE